MPGGGGGWGMGALGIDRGIRNVHSIIMAALNRKGTRII